MTVYSLRRHPAAELLKRYWAVMLAAWQARHELAGPKRLADEVAFLPAALAIQETPVHPAPRRAMWVILALCLTVLAWSCFGQLDIVAVAPGRIVVSDRTKVVQPLEAAVVRAIHVRDGDHVEANQLLIELDPTAAAADSAGLAEQELAAHHEAERSDSLLQALRTGHLPLIRDAEARAQAEAEWNDIGAKIRRQDAEVARREAEVVTAREALIKLQLTVPMARQRESDLAALSNQGYVSSHAVQDRIRERVELERDQSTQKARMDEATAALAESRQAGLSFRAETLRSLTDRRTKALADISQLKQQEAKAAQRERLTRLVAPVSGTIQQLAVHSTGGVVTPAQQLMVVVPDQAAVTAEVTVENKDIGFVQEGQSANIKLETFPFTRYGMLTAVVKTVTADAVTDEKRGAVYPLTLTLERDRIDIDGRRIRLTPGMNVVAEVRTGRRRVIDYLLDPLQRHTYEAMRER